MKNFELYKAFEQIIKLAVEIKQEIRHSCTSAREAQRLRYQLYNFLRAARQSDLPEDTELVQNASTLVFRVEGNILSIKRKVIYEIGDDLQKVLDNFSRPSES